VKNQFASSTAQPRLLNVREAASYLATSVHAVRQLQWNKTVPYLRIGKLIQFDRADLDRFIDAQKEAAR
jgi:excisionase family DNA binding protein